MTRRTKPKTEVKSIYVGLRLQPHVRYRLEDEARKKNVTLTQIVRWAVMEYLEKKAA